MKDKLIEIGIGFFIIINTVFELTDSPYSVPLSIMYFSGLYLSYMIICLGSYIKTKRAFFKYISFAFLIRFIWENTKWGMSIDEYMESVNNYEKSVLLAFLTITITLIAISHARNKRIN